MFSFYFAVVCLKLFPGCISNGAFFLFIFSISIFLTLSRVSFPDTAATLSHVKELPPGIYTVPVDVTDLQGFGGKQSVEVRICQCKNGACMDKDLSTSLGGLGVLAMLLPLLLLLLLCESLPTASLSDVCKSELFTAYLLMSNDTRRHQGVSDVIVPTRDAHAGWSAAH